MERLSFKTRFLNVFRNVGKVGFIEKFLAKLSMGSGHRSLMARLIPNHYQYSTGSFREVSRNGINYLLDISDYVDHNIYFGLTTEENPVIYQSINEGDVVFDIGTNIGHVLLKMAQTNRTGKIYGFEPHPFNFKKAMKNLSLNDFENVELNNLAVSDEEGELSFSEDFSRNMGGFSLKKESTGDQIVKAITIDEFTLRHNIQSIDFIKIDVEGFEHKVINGARNTLIKSKPQLFIEINDSFLKANQDSARSLVKDLIDMGYQIHRVDNGDLVLPSYDFENKHFDILCQGQSI